jgi:hypothetical protein
MSAVLAILEHFDESDEDNIGTFRQGNRTHSYDKNFFDVHHGHADDDNPLGRRPLVPKRPIEKGEGIIHESPGVIHRGMSQDEYHHLQRTGKIKSTGAGNVGHGEHGLTFFTAEPRTALSYTKAPGSSIGHPAYVVSVKRPHESRISINRDHGFEIGVTGDVHKSDVVAVHRGNVIRQSLRNDLKVPTPHEWHWEKVNKDGAFWWALKMNFKNRHPWVYRWR